MMRLRCSISAFARPDTCTAASENAPASAASLQKRRTRTLGQCAFTKADVQLSPDHIKLALATEVKSMLGLRTQHAGMLYSVDQNAVLGRVAIVKRDGREAFADYVLASNAKVRFG